MVKINYNVEDKFNPAIDEQLWWAEINPYSTRRIYIKHKDDLIAAINIPEEIDIRTVEISINSVERDKEADKETLGVEAACMMDEYTPYAILAGYITVKYDVTIDIRTDTFYKKEGIKIAAI